MHEHEHTSLISPVAATELLVGGMTCNNCARHVREALQSVPHVASASWCSWKPGGPPERPLAGVTPNLPALVKAVKDAGYEAQAAETASEGSNKSKWSPLAGWQFNLVVGLCGDFAADGG